MALCLLLRLFVFRMLFFFSSRRRHTRLQGDWSSDVCSSDLTSNGYRELGRAPASRGRPAKETPPANENKNRRREIVEMCLGVIRFTVTNRGCSIIVGWALLVLLALFPRAGFSGPCLGESRTRAHPPACDRCEYKRPPDCSARPDFVAPASPQARAEETLLRISWSTPELHPIRGMHHRSWSPAWQRE